MAYQRSTVLVDVDSSTLLVEMPTCKGDWVRLDLNNDVNN